jgi:hypothetical protein
LQLRERKGRGKHLLQTDKSSGKSSHGGWHPPFFISLAGGDEGARGVKMWRSFFNYRVGLWAVFLFYLNFQTFWIWKTIAKEHSKDLRGTLQPQRYLVIGMGLRI